MAVELHLPLRSGTDKEQGSRLDSAWRGEAPAPSSPEGGERGFSISSGTSLRQRHVYAHTHTHTKVTSHMSAEEAPPGRSGGAPVLSPSKVLPQSKLRGVSY